MPTLADRLASGLLQIAGVEEHPSQFNAMPALWVDGREIANFHPRGRVHLRMTRAAIASERVRLRDERNVEMRGGDWIVVTLRRASDLGRALALGERAVEANRRVPGERRAPVPSDAALAGRRRRHGSSTADLDPR